MPVTSLDGLSKYTSNALTDEVRTKADSAATDTKFIGTSNLIQNNSNDIMDVVNQKADSAATDTKFIGTSNLIQNNSNDIMGVVNQKADSAATDTKFIGTSNLIQNTSNDVSDRITNLSLDEVANGDQNKFIINDQYDGHLSITETLTVSGNLDINGTTTTVNTAVYTTESLEVVSSSLDSNSPALKVTETGTANIIEVYNDSTNVITVDNSGDVTTTGTINGASAAEIGKLAGIGSTTIISQLNAKQNKLTQDTNAGTNVTIDDATGVIDVTIPALDGAISGITSTNLSANKALYSDGSGKVNVSTVTSAELAQLTGIGSFTIISQLNAKQGLLSSSTDVTVKDLTVCRINSGYGDQKGIFFSNNDEWGIYTNSSTGGVSCEGYNFHSTALRLRTKNSAIHGLIYETNDEVCKFSVRGSDGSGYFAGDLQVNSNLTVAGNIDAGKGTTSVNNSSDTGVNRGIRFWGSHTEWAMYMSSSGAGKAPDGGLAPAGYGFTNHAIRIRTSNSSTQGFMIENGFDQNNFSVRGSDGQGYLRGGLHTDGNITTTGTINGVTVDDLNTLKNETYIPTENLYTRFYYNYTERILFSNDLIISNGSTVVSVNSKNITIPLSYHIWTVPYTQSYTFTAAGAGSTGKGVVVKSTISLQENDKIIFACGTKGVYEGWQNFGSGGGGTFITKLNGSGNQFSSASNHTILLVAGGGAGSGSIHNTAYDATATKYGTGGGGAASNGVASGGGGFSGNGSGNTNFPSPYYSVNHSQPTLQTLSFLNGFTDNGVASDTAAIKGGFGGGGYATYAYTGSLWLSGAGGGGGYTGGNAGSYSAPYASGGSSYDINGINNNATSIGTNLDDGYVIIEASVSRTTQVIDTRALSKIKMESYSSSKNYWNIYSNDDNEHALTFDSTIDYGDTFSFTASLRRNGNAYLNFTGVHHCKPNDDTLFDNKYIGYIVSSTKKYLSMNSKYNSKNMKQNIDKDSNDCLPIVELTSYKNDKNVFGVISKIEDYDSEIREQSAGAFVSSYLKEKFDRRLHISGVGEGFVWVCDFNGELEAGDYISSSPIKGIAMRQDDDLQHSYTVGKLTTDCDFNPKSIPLEILSHTIVDGKTVYENDENGNYIYEYDKDLSGNILYDYEYEMKYVKLDGTFTDESEYISNTSNVYRMALLGCSYTCS